MSRDCGQCPQLRAEVGRLRGQVETLTRRIEFLRRVLAQVLGGVRSVIGFLDAEQDHPTMPRRDLLPAVHTRLTYIAEHAEGQRI